jgi:hypothetical protein
VARPAFPPTSRLTVEHDFPITAAITAKLNPARQPFSIEPRSASDNRKPLSVEARSITPPASMIHRRPAQPDTPTATAACAGDDPDRTAPQKPRRTSRDTFTPCGIHTSSPQELR